MKKIISILLSLGLAAALLTGCGSGNETADTAAPKQESAAADSEADETVKVSGAKSADSGDAYKIGVIQYVQHDALDSSNEGFFAALDDSGINYVADQQNAAGEASTCQTIAETLVNDGSDLIFAVATPAAQAVAGVTAEIPIVLTAVTDPHDSGLVADNEAPGGNITGTSDLTPVNEQIDLLQQLMPEAKTIGLLYCSAESNSVLQAEMAKEACQAAGLETVDYTVSSSNEIQTVVESMVGKVDAVYAPTDNMIAAGMATVAMVANENSLPVFCGEEGMVDEGGLATYGINYYELGYKAGQMAVRILTEGADPAEMPIEYLSSEECALHVNEDTASQLGIDISGLELE